MRENAGLIEPSFADAIAMIAASEELPEQLKRHWATSLRQFAKAKGRPPEIIPARYSAVRNDLASWHHAPSGLTPKTVMNHRSNTKRALLYLSKEKGIPEYGAPLTAAWERLRAQIPDSLVRSRLSSFIRWCSANGISPKEVDESVVARFLEYRNRCSKPADDAFRRLLARAWNESVENIADWPKRPLAVPPVKPAVEIEWEEFPKGLRKDVDKYLNGLTKIRKSHGRHVKPLRSSTIRGRRAELQAAARVAVKIGVPIEKLEFAAIDAQAQDRRENLGWVLAKEWRETEALHHRSGAPVRGDRQGNQMPQRKGVRTALGNLESTQRAEAGGGPDGEESRIPAESPYPGVWGGS